MMNDNVRISMCLIALALIFASVAGVWGHRFQTVWEIPPLSLVTMVAALRVL